MIALLKTLDFEDFRLWRGLRQEDLIAPFMFLIVVEGLVGLVRETIKKNIF